MAKINSIKAFRDNLIEAQEKDLSFKSASDGMGYKEESNAMDHLLKSRNRDISCLNKLIREDEVKKLAKITAPPKSLFHFDDKTGQSFIDEDYAKKREKKSFWIGVGATVLIGGILLACNKKKGGEEE